MLKALGYEESIFKEKSFLKPSEMQKVVAGAAGDERDCAVEGCRVECATTCNQCSSGCHQGPDPIK